MATMSSRIYRSALEAKRLLSEINQLFAYREENTEIVQQVTLAIHAIDDFLTEADQSSNSANSYDSHL